ncbi:MAG: NUDIX domain-containing protein [Chloroflexota bacterium]|nr:NUDIX domain-containing protein [Chloroflexota bacterium]
MPISDYIRNIRAKIGSQLLLLPGVTAIVINDRGEVLLQLRRDTGTWAPPSGGVEPGETVAEAVKREVLEEAGIEIEPKAIVAVLSGAAYNVTYPNGDQLASVTTVFRCRPLDAAPPRVNDDESQDIRYFKTDSLPENVLPRHRWMIKLALNSDARAYFDPPSA